MSGKRIGELLSHFVPLSAHDIEEILSEQSTSHKRFGDIALAMGLCRPEHIWRAWRGQLNGTLTRIDLNEFGIDAQAVSLVSSEMANELRLIPVRILDDEIVVATDEASLAAARVSLRLLMQKQVMFVLADRTQIERAVSQYYPVRVASPRPEATAA